MRWGMLFCCVAVALPAAEPDVHTLLLDIFSACSIGDEKDAIEKIASLRTQDLYKAEFVLGLMNMSKGKCYEAEKHFQKCLAKQPNSVDALNNLALVCVKSKHYPQSIAYWKKAIGLDATHKDSVQNIGRFRFLVANGLIPAEHSISDLWNKINKDGYDRHVGWKISALLDSKGQPYTDPKVFEDRRCFVCNGTQFVKCSKCAKGFIKGFASSGVVIHPVTGERIVETRPIKIPCLVCEGSGFVPCSLCDDGIDPSLKKFNVVPKGTKQ